MSPFGGGLVFLLMGSSEGFLRAEVGILEAELGEGLLVETGGERERESVCVSVVCVCVCMCARACECIHVHVHVHVCVTHRLPLAG